MAKWFIQALAFVTVLNLPIARVMLTDKSGLEPPRVVDHVPFALAVIGQTTNLVFGALTNTYETAFGIPEDLGLQKGDVGFGHRILKSVNNATIRDPGLRADLMQFIKECTLYDMKDGVITPQQIVGGIDTWQVIFNTTNPARFVTFNTLTSAPTTDTCTQAANILKTRFNDATTKAQAFYGKQAFTRANSDAPATSLFVSAVGTSYDWILNSASNASDAMKQAMFNNIWNRSRFRATGTTQRPGKSSRSQRPCRRSASGPSGRRFQQYIELASARNAAAYAQLDRSDSVRIVSGSRCPDGPQFHLNLRRKSLPAILWHSRGLGCGRFSLPLSIICH